MDKYTITFRDREIDKWTMALAKSIFVLNGIEKGVEGFNKRYWINRKRLAEKKLKELNYNMAALKN